MADETRTIAWQLVVETQGIERNTASAASSLTNLTKGFNLLRTTIAGIAASAVARQFMDLSDTLTNVQNDIRKVTTSTAELEAVQRALMDSARATGTPLETVAANYRALRTGLEGYGKSARDVITITDTVTKAVKLAGGNASDAEAMVRKLAFAFETGKVTQRDFNSIIRETPDLFKALAAQFPGGEEALRKLGQTGKVTGQELADGIGGAADEIADKFANRIPTIREAFTNVRTSLVGVFAEFDKATGITDLLAKGINEYAKALAEFPDNLRRFILNVREFIEKSSIYIESFFAGSLNSIKLWLAEVGAFFAKAIPSFIPGGEKLQQFFANLAGKAKDTSETIAISTKINIGSTEEKYRRLRAEISDNSAWNALLDYVDSLGTGMKGGGEASDALRSAIAGLQSEMLKVQDAQKATTISLREGAQAAKEYSIAADARRKIDAQIATMLAKGDINAKQAEGLRALSGEVAKAAVEQSRYEAAASLVNAAVEEGSTSQEKAAEKLKLLTAAFEDLQARGDLSAEKMAKVNVTLQKLREDADPATAVTKEITAALNAAQDESAKLAIKNQALAISLKSGEAAGRAYANEKEAELAAEIKIREELLKNPHLSGEVQKAYRDAAKQIAAAKTASEDYAEANRLATDALTFGISAQDQMRMKIEATREAIAKGLIPPEQVAAVEKNLARMVVAVDPLKQTFADAAKSMGTALVNFAVDGAQTFGEFAASVIKDIGRMIAQFMMMQALKNAFAGTSWAGLFAGAGAQGLAVERGNILPLQHGGIIDTPAMFPLRGARAGLMGEAGPEAVMPLARLPGGDLGVRSQPMNLELINNTGVNATARVKTESDRTQLILEAAELGAAWAQSRFNTSVTSGYGVSATNMQRTYGLTRRKA